MAIANTNMPRRGQSGDDIVLGVLDVVARDPVVTQRSVASELGIALGLANAYLKRCVRKGLIKVSQVPPRRYAYYLTPKGFAEKSRLTADYLSHSFSFFRTARVQCENILADALAQGHRRVVLVGDGDLAEIASLVARDHPVDIVGVVAAECEPTPLAAAVAACGEVDAVIVTTLVGPREVFEAALAVFGAERVHVPAFLRVRPVVTDVRTGAAS